MVYDALNKCNKLGKNILIQTYKLKNKFTKFINLVNANELFAFTQKNVDEANYNNKWHRFNWKEEFARQGINNTESD